MRRDIAALDKKYLWHPFTQMQEWLAEEPLVIERGQGCYLVDDHGRKYLDGVSSLWVNVHGHRRPEIDRAIRAQLGRIAHSTFLGLTHPPAALLAERLVSLAPRGLTKVFYSDNGATAVEIALKMAFQYWQQKGKRYRSKTKFISLTGGYHGDTVGAVSVGGIDLFHKIFRPLLFESFQVEAPYCYRCPLKLTYPDCGIACLDSLRTIAREHHREIAALILEPKIQGAAGMIVQPPGFLREVEAICRRYGILLIADEVATGFGRTGRMFACEHEMIRPDFLCLGKGITGGYLPLAATLTTEEIFRVFLGPYEKLRTFFHGHSYTANPLACAAALATLDIFEREETLKHLGPKIALLSRELETFWELPHVGDIRQAGMMAGIELVRDRETAEPYPVGARMGHRVIRQARRSGVILRPLGSVIVLLPPLALTAAQIRSLTRETSEAIRAVTGNGRGAR